ncbi:putative papain-like cysteine peptidase superfamily [Helianthus annuus]|nr:putative papain-like cysteine peptidase superfamily [Helianthus annuus]
MTAVVGSFTIEREILYTGWNNPLFRSGWRHSFGSYCFDRRIRKKDGLDYWRCLNFWGATFGGDGTFYLEKNTNHPRCNEAACIARLCMLDYVVS